MKTSGKHFGLVVGP